MKRTAFIRSLIILILSCPIFTYGQQQNNELSEISRILNELKNTNEISYSYSINVKYPNDQKDHLKGELYINNGHKVLYNLCDGFSMIYSSNWFYKADHRKKTLTIINLEKESKKDLQKDAVEKDVFQNGALKGFVDSVLFKYAIVKSFKKRNDTLKAELSFPEKMNVRNIFIVYSEKNEILISYVMNMFQPIERDDDVVRGVTEVVSCNNFKKNGSGKKYNMDDFFSINKDKLTLTKYNKYKLYSKL